VDGITLEAVERYGVGTLLAELAGENRVAQMAVKLVIEPIFEAGFKASSFGFRPRRSALQALETIRETVNSGCNHVLDADIRDCFGSIDQALLMQRVVSGTPQGGVLSPLLSNVYLDFLDTVWERQCAEVGTLVRYADDFVVICRTPKAVAEAGRRVKLVFERRHGRHLEPGRAAAWSRQSFWDLGLHRLRGTVRYPKPCKLHEKTTGKPCARNPRARFERRRVETGRS
jgi:hypothetical protein